MLKKIVLFLLLLLPVTVQAYGIDNYYVNATVLDNGDMEVEQYFNMTGSYNGMELKLYYKNSSSLTFNKNAASYGGSTIHNGSDITVEEIRAVDINDNFDFNDVGGDLFSKVTSASKGDYAVYTEGSLFGGKDLLLYLPSYKNKAFYVKYKISDLAILHNDIGEIGWNILGKEFTESIDNLVVTINIPNNQNMIKVWGHGPYNGEVTIVDQNTVRATINNLPSYTAIDIRTAFDKEVIANSSKKTEVDALDKIIKYETELADAANRERERQMDLVVDNINNKFSLLDETPSRANYDEILYLIDTLINEEKAKPLREKLHTYQDNELMYYPY